MSTRGLLQRLGFLLERAGVPYMLVGSFASTLHGTPRTTQDIDIVVDLSPGSLSALLSELPEDQYYVSEEAAREAVKRRTQFNIIDMTTGWKIDLIILKRRPYSLEEFSRRVADRILDANVFVATAEDTILSKLEWASRSGSDRQVRDAASVVGVRGQSLDLAYLDHWAHQLGVDALWTQIRPAK